MTTATIIGAGPNGLSAAIVLAAAGIATTVVERNASIGGACSTAQSTLPGYWHDLGSSAYPLGMASPFFRSLARDAAGNSPFSIPWIEPPAPCAHPLDDGTAVMLEHSIADTIANLDAPDRRSYEKLLAPLTRHFEQLMPDLLGPLQHVPRHPLWLAEFGLAAAFPAVSLARSRFSGERAQALFAGMAAHSVLPLTALATSATALVLMTAGHVSGWPIVRGGAQMLSDALASHFVGLGGRIETSHEVTRLPQTDLVLADVTPRQLLRIAGAALPEAYRHKLAQFRYGAGTFKMDYALNAPIPWTAKECSRAATVHLGGTLAEIVASERDFTSDAPFVLLVQPSLFDPGRAPGRSDTAAGHTAAGHTVRGDTVQGHTAWAYCHVPNGSVRDRASAIDAQIERYAPGFRDCVLARSISPPAALEQWNPNLIGGDVAGGAMNLYQLLFRPTPSLYRTALKGLYLCGASTPPGGGVHGMSGFHAAHSALRDLKVQCE